jgi:hypothetical protein
MIKNYFIFFLFLTVSLFGQTQEAILFFKDGTSIKGLGMIKKANDFASFRSRDKILFRVSENDKPDLWTSEDVKGITFIYFENSIIMEYLKVDKYEKMELLEVITDGTVKLYKQTKIVDVYLTSGGMAKAEVEAYYLKRQSEEYPTIIKDNYIKSTSKYFSDCELLVKKIKNHEFTFATLDKLVNFYNDICSEE